MSVSSHVCKNISYRVNLIFVKVVTEIRCVGEPAKDLEFFGSVPVR